MLIQKKKAEDLNLQFYAEFTNIKENSQNLDENYSPIIHSDE